MFVTTWFLKDIPWSIEQVKETSFPFCLAPFAFIPRLSLDSKHGF